MNHKKKVIVITDGDESAKKVVENVAKGIKGTCISASWGNPTTITKEELIQLIDQAPTEPVLVMFDDCGYRQEGPGERLMRFVVEHENVEVIGAIAVASSTHDMEWTHVDVSIDRFGHLTEYGVDKHGLPDLELGRINGDTVYILDELNIPIVIGIGDIGKMAGHDMVERGAPITRKAVDIILERSGFYG